MATNIEKEALELTLELLKHANGLPEEVYTLVVKLSRRFAEDWIKNSPTYMECAECGIIFFLTQSYRDRRLKDSKEFHCPNGHRNYYRRKPEEDKTEIEKLTQEVKLKTDLVKKLESEVERLRAEIELYQ